MARATTPARRSVDPAPPEWRDLVEECIAVADAVAADDAQRMVLSQQHLRRRLVAWARAEFPLTY